MFHHGENEISNKFVISNVYYVRNKSFEDGWSVPEKDTKNRQTNEQN